MASRQIRAAILSKLSEIPMTYASVSKAVQEQHGFGQHFVERELNEMIDRHELKRMSDGANPAYMPGGNVDGKYDDYNSKRLEEPTVNTPSKKEPWKTPLNPDTSS